MSAYLKKNFLRSAASPRQSARIHNNNNRCSSTSRGIWSYLTFESEFYGSNGNPSTLLTTVLDSKFR